MGILFVVNGLWLASFALLVRSHVQGLIIDFPFGLIVWQPHHWCLVTIYDEVLIKGVKDIFELCLYIAVANKSLETINDRTNIFEKIITSIIYKMFCYFVWKNHIKVLLPARGTVKVPVIFNHNFAYSSISEDYIIAFDNTNYTIPNLKINVIGHIKDNITVKSNVIDVGLCYLTSSVQIISFQLQSNNRVVVPFEVTVPQELCKHVELNPSKGYLKAGSSLDIFIRICLKLDIIQPDCCMYFNADSGFLDFPVRIHPSNSKKYYEVRVLVVVTTPFGLKITPDTLNFGTVNTTETVVRIITLANHSRTTMEYSFLKLPERVSIHPNAFGSILSGENILLHIYYSPSAKDLPKNIFTFEDDFILTCSTVAGLNADKLNSKVHKFVTEKMSISNTNSTSTINLNQIYELDHGPHKIPANSILKNKVKLNSLDKNTILKEATIRCHARIHDIPVELSVQKIVFGKIHFKSHSTYTIELRASNLASVIDRNTSYPDFQIRFEFCSNDPSIEFKPKNGKLHSKEVKKIIVIFRPKLNNELEDIFKECLESEITDIETERILEDENSFLNKVYGNRPFPREQVKIFEATTIFYSLMTDLTKIVSAVCFIQFENRKSIEYFGFDTESLKLSIICQTTKPTIILFSDRINFGKCTVGVRHNEWLLVRNINTDPVPLKISLPNPVGTFFCAFAVNGEQLLLPGYTTPINISFIPESETTENEILEVISGTIRLKVNLSGGGIWPSCQITPEDTFNIILTTHERSNNTFIFRVTNTSVVGVRFNVELDWAKERLEPMLDDEASEFGEMLRSWVSEDQPPWFDGPGWTGLQESNNNVFDLGNGGRPLCFSLDPDGVHQITVTFNPPPVTNQQTVRRLDYSHDEEDYNSSSEIFWCRVYAAMLNVHVGRKVLRQFYVISFVEMKTTIHKTSYTTPIPIN
ncbi:Immunoglobulin-like fold [Cinara cedri]|uniref:Immunoglobulin-like fold n=1 Tax=Cinara cedri TaxID=506608 RepID=A0A5E4NEC1_9HEMI|nr:Immunoglobulin-like fold [Cinara cedri]